MLMNKLVVKNSRCRDILIRSMLNHECLNKIYLISPYGSETFLTDPPSLAVDFFFNSPPSPPPYTLLVMTNATPFPLKMMMCSHKIYPLLMILKVKNPTYFPPCFLRLKFFTQYVYIETPRMQNFYFPSSF